MENGWLKLYQKETKKAELAAILKLNEKAKAGGLTLSEEEAELLVAYRQKSLKEQGRVEFGEGILPMLIDFFCDSPYLNQSAYAEALIELTDIFFLFKNESCDCLTDEELLNFMREQFDEVCFGSCSYLAETCLERFSRAVRAGYDGFRESSGRNEYGRFSEETRWDRDLYLAALKDQF